MARVTIDYGTYTCNVEEEFMNEEQKALYEAQKQKLQMNNSTDSNEASKKSKTNST
jgi:hypothetical protein